MNATLTKIALLINLALEMNAKILAVKFSVGRELFARLSITWLVAYVLQVCRGTHWSGVFQLDANPMTIVVTVRNVSMHLKDAYHCAVAVFVHPMLFVRLGTTRNNANVFLHSKAMDSASVIDVRFNLIK